MYREYLDPNYTTPNPAALVPSDVTEPLWSRRVPGAVIWARPGERLYVHVRNGDPDECHSLHVHGLRYGIDSDGAWPRGVAARYGRRSDEILPGQTWTYVFDIDETTIGAWPFHDHVRHVQANIDRGLFGAIIVRDPTAPRVDHEGGRDQPAPTGHHGAGLRRCRVGAPLTGSGPGVSNEGRLSGQRPSSVVGLHPQHRRFGSDISRAHSEPMTLIPAREVGCSAGS